MAENKHIFTRSWAARILLAVFLPMLVLSSVHVNLQESAPTEAQCYACEHHIHHDGHIATAQHLQKCVLCQFLSLPYLAAATCCCHTPWVQPATMPGQPTAATVARVCLMASTRAPPARA